MAPPRNRPHVRWRGAPRCSDRCPAPGPGSVIPEGRPPTRRYRARSWADRHATAIAFVLLAAVAVGAVAGVRWEASARAEDVREEAVARAADLEVAATERRQQICAESRNLRALVGELIE